MVLRRIASSSLLISLALACGGSGNETKPTNDGTMLTPYLAIANTLAADELGPLPELGAQVTAAAEAHRSEPGVDAIVRGAGQIGAQDIKAARTAFKQLSDGMIEYLAAHPEQQAGHVLVHCPMTFGGKGALWVQNEGKVMNPYEGATMLHCGDKLGWDAERPKT